MKTLKDFDFRTRYIDDTDLQNKQDKEMKEELRQEAIKWLKADDARCLYGKPILNANIKPKEVREIVKNWIKQFFNITEDDLKE